MPQIGQLPGPSRTICGCIGQVYSVCFPSEITVAGSSAMPHFGQFPGPSCLISGCMEQVYFPCGSIFAGCVSWSLVRFGRRVILRCGAKLCGATLTAKVEDGALMFDARCRFRGIDLHSAYGIVLFNRLHAAIFVLFADPDLSLSAL